MTDIRNINAFAKECNTSVETAVQRLRELGVVVLNDHYDHDRYVAAFTEPHWLREKRIQWPLSHATGLGAIKHILDPLDVDIVQHDFQRTQNVMLQRKTKSGKVLRKMTKVYYRNRWTNVKLKAAAFNLRGFTDSDIDLYLLACIEAKEAWAFTRESLVNYYTKLIKRPFEPSSADGVFCRWGDQDHPTGSLHFWLTDRSPSRLVSASQLKL